MRALLVLLVTLLAGCPRTSDRVALQDFRTVERACLARAAEILRDESIHLSDEADLVRAIETDLVDPWKAMRARVKLDRLGDDELAALLRRYFDEREIAWKSLAAAIDTAYHASQTEPPVNHRWQYRDSTASAEKTKAIIDAKLAALTLPALPPLAPAPIVDLDPPPVDTTPGAAYFLVGRRVVMLDNSGFRTIATDVDRMDVLPDGRLWACSAEHVAFWDGAKTTDYKPTLASGVCAAGPDGELWVVDRDPNHDNNHHLGVFDRTTWKIVTAPVGDPYDSITQIAVDKDRRIYAYGDGLFVFDKGWRQLGMPNNTDHYNHLLRGKDGHVWAMYDVRTSRGNPTGLSRLTPAGGQEPVYLEDNSQSSVQFASIDIAGAYTVLDPRRNRIVQAKKTMVLPLPLARDHWERENPGPFSVDGAGRIWVDLVDGLNVIEKGGKRTIYPRGSIDGIHEEIRMIAVVGAGPTLVAPSPAATRTIKGTLYNAGKLELVMCGDPFGRECPPGLPRWTATSDAEGNFTFEDVPRWKMTIHGHVGISGEKAWSILGTQCCAEAADLGEVPFLRETMY